MGVELNFLAVTTSKSNAVEYGQCPLESKDVLGIANLNNFFYKAYPPFKDLMAEIVLRLKYFPLQALSTYEWVNPVFQLSSQRQLSQKQLRLSVSKEISHCPLCLCKIDVTENQKIFSHTLEVRDLLSIDKDCQHTAPWHMITTTPLLEWNSCIKAVPVHLQGASSPIYIVTLS